MKKYNIIRCGSSCDIADELSLLAARANGWQWITLTEMEGYFKGQSMRYPVSNSDLTLTRTDENNLFLDRKDESLLHIREVVEVGEFVNKDNVI